MQPEQNPTGTAADRFDVLCEMNRRLATARAELAAQDDFDTVVVNSQLESACDELVSLLVGSAPRTARRDPQAT